MSDMSGIWGMRRPAGDLELEASAVLSEVSTPSATVCPNNAGTTLNSMIARVLVAATVAAFALGAAGCAGGGSPESSPGGEPPNAQDLDNWSENMQSCLQGKGWDVEVSPEGEMNTTVPAGQEDAFETDVKASEASFGYDLVPVYSEDQVREIYKKVVAAAECLTEQGYEPGNPPSEQTFVEQVQSSPGGWDPYSLLYPATMDNDEYYGALGECPRTWH